MSSFNKVILMGNLTRDPEAKFLPSGTTVVNFSIAMNERYTDKDGNPQEKATFVECEAWNRNAEIIDEYFARGMPIHLEGRLQLDQWENDEGEKRSKLKVRVDRFTFVGKKEENDRLREEAGKSAGGSSSSGGGGGGGGGSRRAAGEEAPIEDDVPF